MLGEKRFIFTGSKGRHSLKLVLILEVLATEGNVRIFFMLFHRFNELPAFTLSNLYVVFVNRLLIMNGLLLFT